MDSKYKLTLPEVCLTIMGLPINIAKKVIFANGYECRIISEDGRGFLSELDESGSRVNIEIMSGVITRSYPG
jgi:hypothetical protein